MLRACGLALIVVTTAALALAGCNHPTASAPGATASVAMAASTPAAGAAAASASASDVHAQTKRYRIDISYPRLPAAQAVLNDALRQAGTDARQKFIASLPDPKQYPGLAGRQFQLKLVFSVVARMRAFVSVRERGMADTGGAHPIPIDASFVYDVRANKIIALDDLFTDAGQARQRLAAVARKSLEGTLLAKVPGGTHTSAQARKEWVANMRAMIAEGTRPTPANFREFAILAGAGDHASGLLLIFPPYQVAPYVYGSQTVEVPVDVFANLLKAAYRGDFDTGR